jgi:hypothetical protein
VGGETGFGLAGTGSRATQSVSCQHAHGRLLAGGRQAGLRPEVGRWENW